MTELELSGSVREQLSALRLLLVKARHELIEAEATLAEEQSALHAFRIRFRQKIGHLVDAVQTLEDEIRRYLVQLKRLRLAREMGISLEEAEAAYREAEQEAADDGDTMPPPLDEDEAAEMKQLYRQLARRYHPDFAHDKADHVFRTQMMSAINNAYAAHDVAELRNLVEEPYTAPHVSNSQTEAQIVQQLRAELARCRRRLREIDRELADLREQHVARLWRDALAVEAQGRDLLAEIAIELERKQVRMAAERDFLKVQFEELETERARTAGQEKNDAHRRDGTTA